jgi:hypothetical protein
MNSEDDIALALAQLPTKRSKPSTSYVVLILGCEKWDVLDPEIIGPFPTYQQAYEWIARLPNAIISSADSQHPGMITLTPAKGDYAGWAIINSETAEDPNEYMKSYDNIYRGEWNDTPNAETIAAMEEARRGDMKSFNTVDELMKDLDRDTDE